MESIETCYFWHKNIICGHNVTLI